MKPETPVEAAILANGIGMSAICADGSLSEDYCKYCYESGEFVDKVSMEDYIKMCSQLGAQADMTNEEMKAYCEKLFPTLKRWKQ